MSKFTDRIGEKRVMNNGLEAEIIAYRGCKDVDVRFSNGVIRCNRSYSKFIRGTISDISDYSSRVGERRVMNNGLEAEIIAYRKYDDIDVRFSNGVIRYNTRYSSFINGDIVIKVNRLGERRVMNNGLEAEIIAYRKFNDIDVRFSNGAVRCNRSYGEFKKGTILDKVENYSSRVGEVRLMNCGLEAEIIAYRNANDIDVRFSNGVIRYNRGYENFIKGTISNIADYSGSRLGEKRVMNNGLEAEIIAYRNANDIDVRFSNGVIRYNTYYKEFKRGVLSGKISRLGEKRVMNNGLEAEIIAYRGCKDVDVRFSNGVTRCNTSYSKFIGGTISDKVISYFSRVGEKKVMSNGMEAEIITYKSHGNITIRFEDTFERSCDYKSFSNGCVGHNTLNLSGVSVKKGSTLGNFNVHKLAYRLKDPRDVYYICECTKCGLKDILTPREMLDHKCGGNNVNN